MLTFPLRLSRVLACCAALILPSLLSGCGSSSGSTGPVPSPSDGALPRAVADAKQRNAPVSATLVQQDNTFGFTLFNDLRKNRADTNVFLSPLSLSLALQIAYNGANGDTATGMAQALQITGTSVPDLNNGNAALQASLVSSDPQAQLTVLNGLWTKQGKVQPSFVQTNQTYYGSQLGDTAGLPDNVNAWVNQNTKGRIPTILPPKLPDGTPYSKIIAVIANAVYFDGKWTLPFDPVKTHTGSFTLSNGSSESCQMMTNEDQYDYLRGSNFQMARLPYGSKRMSMLVLLPDTGVDFNALLSGLNAPTLDGYVAQLKPTFGTITLPKFTSSYSADLKVPLTDLGMGIAFDKQRADFTNLAILSGDERAYISFVYHKTFVKVDELGTEAAAATAVGVGGSGGAGAGGFEMVMDHPFFYAIRDDQTGVLLFMGILADPNAASAG